MYKEIFNITFSSVFDKHIHLVKALFIYLILMIGVDYINLNNTVIIDGKQQIQSNFILFFGAFLSYIIYLMVAITTHRILILGSNHVSTWGEYKFTKREWAFFRTGIFMGLILFGIGVPIFLMGIPFGSMGKLIMLAVALLVITIVVSRFSLVFPTIAIEKEITFSEAWSFTKDYKLLVFVTVILFPVVFSLIFGLIYGIAIKFLSALFSSELVFLYSILNIVITVFTISALSATYKLISQEHPEFFNEEIKDDTLRETTIETNKDTHKITIDERFDISFAELKYKLHSQYSNLGFKDIVINKEDSWMLKDLEENNSYILLSHKDKSFIIEIYKSQMIDFIDEISN